MWQERKALQWELLSFRNGCPNPNPRWGLNNQIKRVVDRYAESYKAMAITPDLYRGKVATKPDEANHLMSELNWPNAVQDVRVACEFLISKGCKKVGIVGFCMGGALSLAAACLVNEIDAAAVFYGIPPKQLADPSTLQKPVQFHFGDKDQSPGFSDIAAADALRDTIKSSGKLEVTEFRHDNEDYHKIEGRKGTVAEFHRYSNGNHAFMNEDAPGTFLFNLQLILMTKSWQI
jgi:carboxymethylenebutenolidase